MGSKYIMQATNPHVEVLLDVPRDLRGVKSPEEKGKPRAVEVPLHQVFWSGPATKIKDPILQEQEKQSKVASPRRARRNSNSESSISKKKVDGTQTPKSASGSPKMPSKPKSAAPKPDGEKPLVRKQKIIAAE
jgi:hypothetical protein